MRIINYFNKQSRPFLILLSILLVGLFAFIDYLMGRQVSFAIGFLLPIAFASWFIGRYAGITVSILAVVARLSTISLQGNPYVNYAIPFWNGFIRLCFYLFISYLISELKTLVEREKTFARIDYLTGLANVRSFYELAHNEISRLSRYKRHFTLVFMDIDYFKMINDRFGHQTGNLLLCAVAKAIREQIRAMDTVARVGGDEFAILMPETEQRGALTVVSRIENSLADAMQKEGWPVTFSFGVVTFTHPPASVEEMLKTADEMMYSAKFGKKDKVTYKVFGEE